MTTDLDVAPASGVLSERMKYAQALAAASLLPESYRGKPANVLLAMEYGAALGLDTVTAIQQVNVINGKPSASAQLIGSLVRRAGHRLRVTGDDKRAVAEIVRRDDPDFVFRAEWTIDRASAAGLAGKGTWKQYPAAMLKARAITEVARDACPEALAGVSYTPEELGDDETPTWTMPEPREPIDEQVNVETGEIIDAEVVPEPVDEPATDAQLKAIAAILNKCGVTDKTARLFDVAAIVGRPLETSHDLTKTEASQVIDTLRPIADHDNPVSAYAEWRAA